MLYKGGELLHFPEEFTFELRLCVKHKKGWKEKEGVGRKAGISVQSKFGIEGRVQCRESCVFIT